MPNPRPLIAKSFGADILRGSFENEMHILHWIVELALSVICRVISNVLTKDII